MKKKWKEFEKLAADIQKQLSPNAVVTHNDKIKGRSGRVRQIDISIKQKIGQFDVLIVIDCKDYKKRVDIKDVESVIGQVQDVMAHQGAIISSSGFTKTAKERAKLAGIKIYELSDSLPNKLTKDIGLPALCSVLNLKSASFKLEFEHSSRFEIPCPIVIYDHNKEQIGSEIDLLNQWWMDNKHAEEGEFKNITYANEKTFLMSGDDLIPVRLTADVAIEKILFYRVWPIQFLGFKDSISESYLMQQITASPLSISILKEEWIRLSDRNDLAIKTIITIGIRTINRFDQSN